MLPTESHQGTFNSAADARFHGTSGPVQTSFSPWYAATHPLWHESVQKLGIAKNPSALNGSNIGAWTVIQSVDGRTGKRSYAASAYVHDGPSAARKPNLIILTGALVRRILFATTHDGRLRATGVEFSSDQSNTVFHATAELEVVVAAGTVQSPQILELSGIGSNNVLEQVGIRTQYHNPGVGCNLQDHLSMWIHPFPCDSHPEAAMLTICSDKLGL